MIMLKRQCTPKCTYLPQRKHTALSFRPCSFPSAYSTSHSWSLSRMYELRPCTSLLAVALMSPLPRKAKRFLYRYLSSSRQRKQSYQ